jgi:hypothetical protein
MSRRLCQKCHSYEPECGFCDHLLQSGVPEPEFAARVVKTVESASICCELSHTVPEIYPASSGLVLPQKRKSELTPAEQKGQSLYEYYCALCHGKTGKADGFNSYNLTHSPKNLADRAQMAVLSDSQIEKVIRDGGPPAWACLLRCRHGAVF